MATITAAAGGGNWNAGATWVGGVAPTSADDVLLTATSGNVTINVASACKSLDCTGYTGTLTHNSGQELSVFGAFKLVAGMTYTLVGGAGSSLKMDGGVTHNVTTAGKNIGNFTMSNGTTVFQDTFTSLGRINLGGATLNTNGQTVTCNDMFVSGTAARTLTLGASQINLTGTGTVWDATTVTSLTLNAGTSTISLTTASASARTFAGGGKTYFNLTYTVAGSTGGLTITGANSFNDLAFSDVTNARTLTLPASTTTTILGSFGNVRGTAGKLMSVVSSTAGTATTLALPAGRTRADFLSIKDVTVTGGALVVGASTNVSGNSGVTFAKTVSTAGGNWTATTAWTDGVVPLASDDVVTTPGSGSLTINAAAVCRSLDCTGYTATLTHNAFVLSIGDATAGAGGVALKLVAGMTYTVVNITASELRFVSSSATQQTIATGGKTIGSMTIPSGSGSYLLSDNLTASNFITQSVGTFNTNAKTVTCFLLSVNGSSARTLTITNSTIIATRGGGVAWDATGANLTLNTTGSTINLTGNGGQFVGAGRTYATLVFSTNGTITGSNTFTNITLAPPGSEIALTVTAGTTQTVSGVFTMTGSSARFHINTRSTVDGTPFTIALGATGTATLTDVWFMDTTFTGTNAPVSGTRIGNLNGNSGITFTASATRYWVGGSGSYSDSQNHWAASSGGATAVNNFPLPQHDVIFDANSFSADGSTVTMDRTWLMRDWDCSAIDQTVTFAMTAGFFVVYGDMAWSNKATTTTNCNLWLDGASVTITSNGGSLPTVQIIEGLRPDSTRSLSLADDFSVGWLQVGMGTFNSNDHNVTVTNSFGSSGTRARTINMGSGTWTLTGTGTVWDMTDWTNLTLNPGASLVRFTDVSATAKTVMFPGNRPLYDVEVVGGGTGTFTFSIGSFSGNITFHDLTLGAPKTYVFVRQVTFPRFEITGALNVVGTAGNLVTIRSDLAGSKFQLYKTSGIVAGDYLSLKDSEAAGGADWYAGRHSTSVSGNSGWRFFDPVFKMISGAIRPRPFYRREAGVLVPRPKVKL